MEKVNILVMADSRGRLLDQYLTNYSDDTRKFRVVVKSGAGLERLWESAVLEMKENKVDILFILGGVCDITDLRYDPPGKRNAWPPTNIDLRFAQICSLIDNISVRFKSLNTNTLLSLIPEAGLDLIQYNKVKSPIPKEALKIQEKLENLLPSLHEKTRITNRYLGSRTALTLDATHARRGGQLHPVYPRLADGLHPTPEVAKKLVRAIATAAEIMISSTRT